VAAMFRELGAAIVDADEATHAVYEPGTRGFEQVVHEFGQEFVRDGRIDRARLGDLVFRDPHARQRLNLIVHPLVREWMVEKTAQAAGDGAEVVIQDVPLLFENALQGLYSATVLVYASPANELSRLVEQRGLSASRANGMIAAQMPIGEKRALADFVVDNDGDVESTRAQVEAIWPNLLAR